MKILTPKCPHCAEIFTHVDIAEVSIVALIGDSHKGIAYCCPKCHTAITVVMDQVSVMAEGVRRTGNLLKK